MKLVIKHRDGTYYGGNSYWSVLVENAAVYASYADLPQLLGNSELMRVYMDGAQAIYTEGDGKPVAFVGDLEEEREKQDMKLVIKCKDGTYYCGNNYWSISVENATVYTSYGDLPGYMDNMYIRRYTDPLAAIYEDGDGNTAAFVEELEEPEKPEGVKWDTGKLQWGLLPVQALREVVRVMTWATTREDPKPYPPDSWKSVESHRYVDALYRHLDAYLDPNQSDIDEESGIHTLAHAVCNCLFLLYQELMGTAKKYR